MTARHRLLLAAAIGVAVTACGSTRPPAPEREAPLAVKTASASIETVHDDLEAGGVIRGAETAVISSRIVAPVDRIAVRAGDRVKAGQVLVVLDRRQFDAEAGRATAALDAARQGQHVAAADRDAAAAAAELAAKSYQRIASLAATGSATRQELDEAAAARDGSAARTAATAARIGESERAVAAAEDAARAARVAQSYGVLVAPFDAIVTSRSADPGTLASPGVPLVTIESAGRFTLDVSVDESRVAGLSPGMRVPVSITDCEVTEGTVAEIDRAVDAASRLVRVRIALPQNAALRSGAFGKARVPGAARDLVTIPDTALVRQGQLSLVYVVSDGTARLRAVREAGPSGDRIALVAGLRAGELVVVSPPENLRDGRAASPGGTR